VSVSSTLDGRVSPLSAISRAPPLRRQLAQQAILRASAAARLAVRPDDDERGCARVARQERQQRQAGGVRGLQIVEHDQERKCPRELHDAGRDAVEELEALLIRVGHRRARRDAETSAEGR